MGFKEEERQVGKFIFFFLFPFQSHFDVGTVDLASPSQTIPCYVSVLC